MPGTPVQSGVIAGAIDKTRAAEIGGRVLDAGQNPLSGVRVSVLGKPQYGYTVSRLDGVYDFVANGGSQIVIQFERPGYLPVQRQANSVNFDYNIQKDVIMMRSSVTSEQVMFSNYTSSYASMKGEVTTDNSGTRQPILLIQPATTATMTLTGRATADLSNPVITVTEYSSGPKGYLALPATLGLNMSYTYFTNIDVSDSSQSITGPTTFSQPLIVYLDEFLGLNSGTLIPSGHYDPTTGMWTAAPNGLVITITGISSSGQAVLDIDGSTLDTPITQEELQMLAVLYPGASGKTLWRVPVNQSGIWGFTWPSDRAELSQ